ncbi:helix-turn-helix transcriptional regulator [Corynebacterium bovis]|uniref:helix-turn-helix transcriptional regulator n=1 Tax=Corynebacterium bovis TaxID=36808 RepID=UPI00254BFE37|nr:helix-turn-helix transcriptional regulator [Corynebacterium bovis]MDK8511398.1 helix-turn-helix transcriptional regulator [Corynebacterium bovis]
MSPWSRMVTGMSAGRENDDARGRGFPQRDPGPDADGDGEEPRFPWDELSADMAERLRELRLRAGLTQAELADLSGVTRNHISGLEAGPRQDGRSVDPRLSTLYRLAAALGVPPAAVFPLPGSMIDPDAVTTVPGRRRPRREGRAASTRPAATPAMDRATITVDIYWEPEEPEEPDTAATADTNTADTATNTADTATNTADTATNTADTATNTTDTATNTTDTAPNTADTATDTPGSAD